MERKYSNEALSRMLYDAQKSKLSVDALSGLEPALTVDDAYEIQINNVNKLIDAGEVISGKKIGLTSTGMQQLLGVNEPDYGHLFESMECRNGIVDREEMLQPKVEGEIAFILKKDLKGPGVTVEDVLDATDYVAAALEIVDSRVRDWKIKLVDTVADNASSGCYVLSSRKIKLEGISLRSIHMTLYKNGEMYNQGTGADVLGDPAYSVAWLANKMAIYGVHLKKGEVILSGAFSAAPPAAEGDRFEAVFDLLGSVEVEFL